MEKLCRGQGDITAIIFAICLTKPRDFVAYFLGVKSNFKKIAANIIQTRNCHKYVQCACVNEVVNSLKCFSSRFVAIEGVPKFRWITKNSVKFLLTGEENAGSGGRSDFITCRPLSGILHTCCKAHGEYWKYKENSAHVWQHYKGPILRTSHIYNK